MFSAASLSIPINLSLSIEPPSIITEAKNSLPLFCFLTLKRVFKFVESIKASTYLSTKLSLISFLISTNDLNIYLSNIISTICGSLVFSKSAFASSTASLIKWGRSERLPFSIIVFNSWESIVPTGIKRYDKSFLRNIPFKITFIFW